MSVEVQQVECKLYGHKVWFTDGQYACLDDEGKVVLFSEKVRDTHIRLLKEIAGKAQLFWAELLGGEEVSLAVKASR